MEKMDQTRTDCNLTYMGFPGETPGFAGEMYAFLGISSGCQASEKIPHRLFSGMRDRRGRGGQSA